MYSGLLIGRHPGPGWVGRSIFLLQENLWGLSLFELHIHLHPHPPLSIIPGSSSPNTSNFFLSRPWSHRFPVEHRAEQGEENRQLEEAGIQFEVSISRAIRVERRLLLFVGWSFARDIDLAGGPDADVFRRVV